MTEAAVPDEAIGIISGHTLRNLDDTKLQVELVATRAADLGNELGMNGYKVKSTTVKLDPKTRNVEIYVRGRRK